MTSARKRPKRAQAWRRTACDWKKTCRLGPIGRSGTLTLPTALGATAGGTRYSDSLPGFLSPTDRDGNSAPSASRRALTGAAAEALARAGLLPLTVRSTSAAFRPPQVPSLTRTIDDRAAMANDASRLDRRHHGAVLPAETGTRAAYSHWPHARRTGRLGRHGAASGTGFAGLDPDSPRHRFALWTVDHASSCAQPQRMRLSLQEARRPSDG